MPAAAFVETMSTLAPMRVPGDLVVCNDALQHVHENDVEQSLDELHRVLRREGAVLLALATTA